MRLFRRTILALIAIAVLSSLLAAASVEDLKPTGYVNDFAGVLSPGQKAALAQEAEAIQRAFGVQVALVTVKSLQGDSAFDLAYHFAHTWGVGQKGKDNGLLILLAIQDHKYSTQVGYGLEPYITDADAGRWARDLIPQLRAGQYGAFFAAMLQDASQTLAARMGRAAPTAADQRLAAAPVGRRQGIPWQTIVFLIVIFAAFSLMGRFGGNTGGCLWLPLMFGGFGGFGGGGWGGGGGFGGGGGGGFGGFGGGGFGGGGASGGW
ncbi:MAG: TPM domain-containing protein [Terriglobales bacterium]